MLSLCFRRILHRTRVYNIYNRKDNRDLPNLLSNLVLKMTASPIDTPTIISAKKRTYLKMNESQMFWGFVAWKTNCLVNTIPIAEELIFLSDFGGGADGRAWFVCSKFGLVCVLKFFETKRVRMNEERKVPSKPPLTLQQERANWKIVNTEVSFGIFAKHYALKLPYYAPVHNTQKNKAAVMDEIKRIAALGCIHDDLRWRHVGWKTADHKVVRFFDLTSVVRYSAKGILKFAVAFMVARLFSGLKGWWAGYYAKNKKKLE